MNSATRVIESQSNFKSDESWGLLNLWSWTYSLFPCLSSDKRMLTYEMAEAGACQLDYGWQMVKVDLTARKENMLFF